MRESLAQDFEALREKLDAASFAPHRRAYGYHLLNAGVNALQAGRTGLAEHCLAQLGVWLPAQEAGHQPAAKTSPWESWDIRFMQTGFRQTKSLVTRHGARLTPMERRTYLEQLDGEATGKASYWAIRRAIATRLIRSRLNALRPPALKTQASAFDKDMPVGPYNHRKTLEHALARLEGADPGWVRDFLRIYTEGLTSIGDLNVASKPQK